MEKRKPTYDLDSIKSEFCTVARLRMTRTARNDAFGLGFGMQDVVNVIHVHDEAAVLQADDDFCRFQDLAGRVLPAGPLLLYVKFTIDDEGKLLIGFKEK